MGRQHLLEEVVRVWVEEVLPGQETVADQAVEVMKATFRSGNSVPVACRRVTEFINCRVQHPAHREVESHAMALLAS